MKLNGKVAIVTGGARDIGRATSIELARNGAKVVVNYFSSKADADETLAQISKIGGQAIAVHADLTKEEGAKKLVTESQKAYGQHIDILVNNAGGLVARKKLQEMDLEFWDLIMRLNVTSVFSMTKAVAPHMPVGSSIINLASQAGRDGGGGGASAYATSKGAVMTFTRAMAKELGPQGIRVNALCPGLIGTKFHDDFTGDAIREKVAGMTPLRREGTAAEIGRFIACLASEESSFIAGANIDINGGLAFS
ncbi:UNVERIFIED_CONTAM: hypothetical protein GTU68_021116 [Idotea baltica]|nr:hypothetical protein [Idotea baltica]